MFLFVAICLVAANLRMTIMGVGPLLEQIAAEQGVSSASLGALAALPLIAWGIVSPLAHGLSVRLGMSRTVTWSLIVLAIGTVLRSVPGSPANLWIGTALIGASLAIGNVLLPAIIKREFDHRLSLVMGVYTALLGGTSSVASGFVVPLSHLEISGSALGWRFALLMTGLAIPPAFIVWVWANRKRSGQATPPAQRGPVRTHPYASSAGRAIWRDPLAWAVAGYMGAQSAVFYIISTWLAPISAGFGRSAVLAGFDVMLFQVVGVAGSLCFSLVFHGRMQRLLPVLLPAVAMAMSCGIVLVPTLLTVWIMVAGVVAGTTLSLSVMLTAMRARTAEHATALSGMAQSVGYLLAAAGPIVFGLLYDFTHGWGWPLAFLVSVSSAQLGLGFSVGRETFVLDRAGKNSPAGTHLPS